MATSTIKVHLADDHQVLIDGLLAVLGLHPSIEVVGFSLDGNNLRERIASNHADILVLDINMPEADGISVLKDFRAHAFPCKVIVLSSYNDIKTINEVVNLGARGFLSKNAAGDEIATAIQEVHEGNQYFSADIRDRIVASFVEPEHAPKDNSPNSLSSLTKRELEVLKLIVAEQSGQEIAEKLNISKNTVESHRKNLFKKLQVNNSVGLVKFYMNHSK